MVAVFPEKVITPGFSDCHCHLLPGMDDGPSDMQESIEMSRILTEFGFSEVICTPHLLKGAYDHQPERIRSAVASLQTTLDENGVPLTVKASVEYHLDEYLLPSLDDPLPVQEGVILVESHRYMQPLLFNDLIYRIIVQKRLRPLLAHPERCEMTDEELMGSKTNGFPSFLRAARSVFWKQHEWRNAALPKLEGMLCSLRDMGCLFQGNIGSFAGIYGEQVRKRALQLLHRGLYDRLGTDAHRQDGLADWLKRGMKMIRQAVGEEGLSRLLRPLDLPES